MIERFPVAHENLGPAGDRRDPRQAPREINAIGNNINTDRRRRRPKGLGLTEAVGYRLQAMEHYGKPIRSTRTEGRANVALYLRNGLTGPPPWWVQHTARWPKVNNPRELHAPRVTLVKLINNGPTLMVGHAPQAPNRRLPRATNAALREAREEWVDDTVGLLRDHKLVIWLGDPNFLLDEVFRQLGASKTAVAGTGTDAVLTRGYAIKAVATPGVVNRVPMLTDHRMALLARLVLR